MPERRSEVFEGQVAASEGVIYTATVFGKSRVNFMSIFNTSATPQTVIVYFRTGQAQSDGAASTTSRKIIQCVLEQNESANVIGEGNAINLLQGDTVRAETTTGSVVDYVIAGEVEIE